MDKNHNLQKCALLVAGPIISRCAIEQLSAIQSNLQRISSETGLQIVVATYQNEWPFQIFDENFKLVVVEDPGKDRFELLGKPKIERNTSRLLDTVNAGLSVIDRDFTIKTRIELLSQNIKLKEFLILILENFRKSRNVTIAVLANQYQGLVKPAKGSFLWIPDTFQVMRTDEMARMWSGARKLWSEFKDPWNTNFNSAPANEQIIGLSFGSLCGAGFSREEISNFSKKTFNRKIHKQLVLWETKFVQTIQIEEDIFPVSHLVSTSGINRKEVSLPLNATNRHHNFYFSLVERFIFSNINLLKLIKSRFTSLLKHMSPRKAL